MKGIKKYIMRKKLLVFHPTIAPYRIDFFNDLCANFDTKICLRYENLRDQKFNYTLISNQFSFKPYYLNMVFEKGGFFYSKDYWNILDQFQPDIVVVEEFNLSAVLVLLHKKIKRKKYKIVSICDDSYNMVAEHNDFSKIHRIARKFITPLIDDLILVEPKVVNWYQKKYRKGFWFPIIKDEFKARLAYKRVLDGAYRVFQEFKEVPENVYLFVGRLVAIKNVHTIIESFSALDQKKNLLVVVGDGDEYTSLSEFASKLNLNVFFAGRLEGDELYKWYCLADFFVLASIQEAFGAVTNEALLAGCVCLISEKAGSSCLIEEGLNGYTFNPLNSDELTVKMKKVITMKQKRKNTEILPNKMKYSYKELMEKLINRLNSL